MDLLPKEFPLSDFIVTRKGLQPMCKTLPGYEFLEQVYKTHQEPAAWPSFSDMVAELAEAVVSTAEAVYDEDTEDNPKGTLMGIALRDLRLVFADPEMDEDLAAVNEARVNNNLPARCVYVKAVQTTALN